MIKYYYTDPLKAAWMSKEHGVGFIYPDEDKKAGVIDALSISGSISIDGSNTLRYKIPYPIQKSFLRYIHPDNYEMLKPQDGDLGDYQSCIARYFIGLGWLLLYGKTEIGENPEVKIIQRDKITFFAPEIEI